ncbi:uncharacterized protein G2W53_018915 [Senna tora]|uniref:Uncharacterized protein n=1 Tax=Senna tora TaxID=362788 RepID=A0A834WQ87_9FABA|nr:uncharacterized protein G2W53_018915 [Senna tora]
MAWRQAVALDVAKNNMIYDPLVLPLSSKH